MQSKSVTYNSNLASRLSYGSREGAAWTHWAAGAGSYPVNTYVVARLARTLGHISIRCASTFESHSRDAILQGYSPALVLKAQLMPAIHHRKLPLELPIHWALLCGRAPPDDLAFHTNKLQIIYNNAAAPWRDEAPHAHSESDEVYIVQEGAMVIAIDGELIVVDAGEFLCVPTGTIHQLVEVRTPHKSFVIRSPSVNDKVNVSASVA